MEQPDETARGSYLELLVSAGLAFDLAPLRFLAAADPRLEPKVTPFRDGAVRKKFRKRPPLPR